MAVASALDGAGSEEKHSVGGQGQGFLSGVGALAAS